MKKIIELKNITKSFDGETVLDDISLDIYDNEFLTLLGPSGCGKTTTLRLIGGFETPDKGDIIFMGENINDVPPYKRNVNTVFQRYALFPHLNVFENIAFPLREKKVDRDEIEEKVEEMLALVALKGFEHRSVTSLSGGQQQRVAIARALVSRPKVLLLDEPLAALDLKLRKDMQQELKKIQKATGITFVFVTHDQAEAMSMSSHIAVLHAGAVEQYDTPEGIYHRPATQFVARFVGKSNWLNETELFRPETATLEAQPELRRFELPVVGEEYLGESYNVQLQYQNTTWTVHARRRAAVGERLSVYIDPNQIIVCNEKEKSAS